MKIKEILATNSDLELETSVLLCSIINHDKSFIYAYPEYELTLEEEIKWNSLFKKFQEKIPLAYILKEKEFYGRNFHVDHRVLIPRPETEAIVDQAIKRFVNSKQPISILEIGIGSGALLISIVIELEKRGVGFSQIIGSDISLKALTVAKMNLRRYHLQHQVRLIKSDLFKVVPRKKFDLILANLPYLPTNEAKLNMFEPQLALNGGVKGDELINQFLGQVSGYKKSDGIVILEKYNGEIQTI